MAQRDKNGETASERIARRVFYRIPVDECNTRTVRISHKDHIVYYIKFYAADIATLWECGITGRLELRIVKSLSSFSGSKTLKARKQALINEAKRQDIKVIEG